MKKLLLIGLNEVNFDLVKKYCSRNQGKYKNLEALESYSEFNFNTEDDYLNLEPWIQWASIHTGKKFAEHQIFRLGDVVNSKVKQIYETLEENHLEVGAVSPMNAKNNLNNAKYFIPDPWTNTASDESALSKSYHQLLIQSVNDNSKSRLTIKSIFTIIYIMFFIVRKSSWYFFAKYLLLSSKKKWFKALFLDLMTHEVHLHLLRKNSPNFSEIFLNSIAHIQHHYFMNFSEFNHHDLSKNPNWYIKKEQDPFVDSLGFLDMVVGDYMSMQNNEVIFSTALTQVPISPTFYYRLSDHRKFLESININFTNVSPRMTRDFEILFKEDKERDYAESVLQSIRSQKDIKVFGEIEKRPKSLFVTLTYPYEIDENSEFFCCGKDLDLNSHVVFVAIKNGKHSNKSFTFIPEKISKEIPTSSERHISEIFFIIKQYFGVS